MSKLLAGRYELLEKIGEGGMAIVYKARCNLLNRYVAIKILRPEFTKDTAFIENFRRESQAAAGLQSPNIVSVYDVGNESNIYFIVMELIDGRPLSEIIEEEAPMHYTKVMEIGKQIASALETAHRKNIIHRDVKPHNIMITSDGIAKLADFGIARAVSSSTLVNSEVNKIMGSVHYFSPEQARGSHVDARSDVYSLGIVLYEMLTGKIPFDGQNPVQVALSHLNDEIVPPSRLVAGVPPALEKLIMKATDKYPTRRFENAAAMLEELKNVEFVTNVVAGGERRSPVLISDDEEMEDIFPKVKNGKTAKRGNETSSKRKEQKSGKWMKILLFIGIILIAIGAGIFAINHFMTGSAKEVTVPDVKGMTYDEADKMLKDLKLKIEKGKDVPSADVEKGKIATQSPSSGSKVKEGSKIKVSLSKGKKAGVIPDLRGKTYGSYDEINSILSQYGFRLGEVREENSDTVEKGVIISQNPGAGSTAKNGTVVSIVVSLGKKDDVGKVPTLTGLTVEEAKAAIRAEGFEVGEVTYKESSVYGKDYVMWQQYGPNTELKKGTTIDFRVSKGTPEVETPEPETPENGNGGEQ